MSVGADDYLAKPFSAKEVFDAIRTRLERVVSVSCYADQRHHLALKLALGSFQKRDRCLSFEPIRRFKFGILNQGKNVIRYSSWRMPQTSNQPGD